MTFHLALAGKGSAGKSTLLPHLIYHLRHALPTARLLVVDADPHMSATVLLGIAPATTLGELRSRYERQLACGNGLRDTTREAFAEQAMGAQALVHTRDYDLLTMGHWALPGSQCVVNRVLERALSSLAGRYDLVVYDNEAGIEHIGRFAAIPLDLLLLVATPNPLFLDVAGRIVSYSGDVQRQIKRCWLVLNRAQAADLHDHCLQQPLSDLAICGAQLMAVLPESAGLQWLSRTCQSPLLLEAGDPWHKAVAHLGAAIACFVPTPTLDNACAPHLPRADRPLCP